MGSSSFVEIEYKYLVGKNFDQDTFAKKLKALNPLSRKQIKVRDIYYVLNGQSSHIFRHRYDHEIQQLTVKSWGSVGDVQGHGRSVVRTEINLPIEQKDGDQRIVIASFMRTLGVMWEGEVIKDIDVSYFPDCEVVFYRAVSRDKEVQCVEIEAIGAHSVEEGIKTIQKYESILGFLLTQREPKNLFEILLVEDAPSEVKDLFKLR